MKSHRVLLVEDNKITRGVFRVALESQGWVVAEAGDGATALDLLTREFPDVVVMDLNLPDMDGLELLKKLRATGGGKSVPVVAVSGFLSKLERAGGRELGFADLLSKPVDPERLVAVVGTHLRRSHRDRPGHGIRVLLVDDDPAQGRQMALRLTSLGFTVTTTGSGAEAVEQIAGSRPDLVLSDGLMPLMDGFRLSHTLRSDPRYGDLPVVLLSVMPPEEEDRALARRAGARDLLARGVEDPELAEALLLALEPGRSGDLVPGGDVTSEATLPVEDYTHRILRRLEHRVARETDLASRVALQEAVLGVLVGLGETARGRGRGRGNAESMLPELLHDALGAAGISQGAIFLFDKDGTLALNARHGFPEPGADLADIYGHGDLLRRVAQGTFAVKVPALDTEETWEAELLSRARSRSMQLIPLRLGDESIGVLVLATARRQLPGEWLPFAEAIGTQIARAVALARSVARISREQETFQQLADAMPHIVWSAGPDGLVDYHNQRWHEFSGRPRESGPGGDWTAMLHLDDREACLTRWKQAIASGEPFVDAYRFRFRDGETYRWLMGRALPARDEAGKVTRWFGTWTDITEMKTAEQSLRRTEEQLRRSQKMEAVGRLAGGVAHDFNNLLTVIAGYTQLLAGEFDERDPLRQDIEEIRKAVDRASSLTQQLLIFSRHEPVAPKVLDLNSMVAEMEKMVRRIIGEDIDFRVILAPGACPVKVDKGHLETVVLNLCVNSRDALPRGGKLRIETSHVEQLPVDGEPAGGDLSGPYIRLLVRDTGCGMSAEVQSHLFEPFFTTKEAGKGTGLGLSTVFGIVQGAGGQIVVSSEEGKGTTFELFFPAAMEREAPGAVVEPHRRTTMGTETILLVEDEHMVRHLAQRVLERSGYRVLACASGGEALLVCEQYKGPIHMLLTDVIMPRMSGPELRDRLARERPGLKVIFCSGYTTQSIHDASAVDAGVAFVQKPFSHSILLEKVRAVLDGPD